MLAALMLLSMSAAPESSPKLFALVVGHNRAASAATADLRYADDDALALHQLLLEAGARSVLLVMPDDETRALGGVSTLTPTEESLAMAWKQLRGELTAAKEAGHRVEFLFFFSGHGDISHGEGFLALDGGKLTRPALQAMLAASPAHRNHVIIDACKAYFAVMGKGPGGTRAPWLTPFAATGTYADNSGFLLSTSSDGDSHEWERYQAGVFSFEVRSALRGSADIDGDGVVTYRELGGFLTRANAGITNARLRPDFLVAPPGGARGLDEPVLRWPAEAASLIVDGAPEHLYVEAGSGHRVLELNRGSARTFRLQLPAHRPLFVRSADEKSERRLDSAERTELSSIAVSRPDLARKGALAMALKALFSQPFDESAVEAFTVAYAVEQPVEAPSVKRALRTVSPVVFGVAAATGLVSLGVAVERSQVNETTSNLERVQRNEGIAAANVTMGISAAVAATAIGLWIFSWTGEPEPSKTVEVGVSPTGVSVMGRF
ncbi:MAG: caspase family protein [Archangium sp.]